MYTFGESNNIMSTKWKFQQSHSGDDSSTIGQDHAKASFVLQLKRDFWFAGVRECPPWYSIVGATVTVHQFFCILLSCALDIKNNPRFIFTLSFPIFWQIGFRSATFIFAVRSTILYEASTLSKILNLHILLLTTFYEYPKSDLPKLKTRWNFVNEGI